MLLYLKTIKNVYFYCFFSPIFFFSFFLFLLMFPYFFLLLLLCFMCAIHRWFGFYFFRTLPSLLPLRIRFVLTLYFSARSCDAFFGVLEYWRARNTTCHTSNDVVYWPHRWLTNKHFYIYTNEMKWNESKQKKNIENKKLIDNNNNNFCRDRTLKFRREICVSIVQNVMWPEIVGKMIDSRDAVGTLCTLIFVNLAGIGLLRPIFMKHSIVPVNVRSAFYQSIRTHTFIRWVHRFQHAARHANCHR